VRSDYSIYEGYWSEDVPHDKRRMIHPNGEL
jgi:hypothetical protein